EAGTLRDAVTALSELAPLTPLLAERKETIQGFLDSPILRPEIIDVIGNHPIGHHFMISESAPGTTRT
ncbi:MAG: hypothetical protein ACKOAX_03305, partial [Candidatus Kapaibacterium sp.]